MSEKETETADNSVTADEKVESSERMEATAPAKKSPIGKYIGAVVIVCIIILGVFFLLEKEGRSSTSMFASIIEKQEANAVVALVNGEEIINSELDTSIKQFIQVAVAQGVDANNPDVQVEIRAQALDVLVNTELLKQAAADKGLEITDEEVSERLQTIEAEIGGPEILVERMETLGISNDQLQNDVKDELLIQELIDIIFAEAEITVSDEEISEVYENASVAQEDLPALEEVRAQVEEQILASKEQAAIDAYLGELKDGAEIEIK